VLRYPYIDPVAVHWGVIQIHWYGLMYVVGLVGAWGLGLMRSKSNPLWNKDQVADMIFYAAVGIIVGGRLGYMIFYNTSALWQQPLEIFKVWDGGMSFHGGMCGVALALYFFARREHKSWLAVTDFAVPLVPIGLAAGRLGNFINGELWGRVTTMPWGMIFPEAGALPRHPSQLYELFLEGIILFVVLWCYSTKVRSKGAVSGLFLLLYGIFRFIIEFFRQPDSQLGFVALGWLTRGQELCIPMMVVGLVLMVWSYRRKDHV
jgi:phosphatidylglycerol---prolipoprotein diacylglyceryl transferase